MITETSKKILQDMDNYVKEQALKEYFYASLLAANVSEVEIETNPAISKTAQALLASEGSTMLVKELAEILDMENSPFNPMLRRHLGRPVYSLDCRLLRKGDAIGWLEAVSKLPKAPKPILVVENITDIPEEDGNHDNPQYVRNLLMHSWKNPMNDLFNASSENSFKIIPVEYTIFITCTPENREKMEEIHQQSDGFAKVGNIEKYRQKLIEPYKNCTLKELEAKHIVSFK